MSDMTIALVLNALNNMGGGISSATNDIRSIGREVQETANNVRNTRFFDNTWLDNNIKLLDEMKKKSQEMVMDGAVQVAKGYAELQPIKDAVTLAGDFEDVMTDVKTSIYDSTVPLKEQAAQLKSLDSLALKLGADTRYSNLDAANSELALAKGGEQIQDILAGDAEAALKLAQAGKVSTDFSTEAMIKIGNAYGVHGKGMLDLADTISRVDSASTASISSLAEGMQFASAVASNLGQSYKDTSIALAALNNSGINGSNAGTNYADFLRRLAPETPMAIKMQAKLGLSTLSSDEVANIKKGQDMLGLAGKDLFHDSSGKVKPLVDIIQTLRDHTKGLRADVVQVAFDKMFGVEGGRAALALLKEGKGSIEDIYSSYNRQMSLNDRIAVQQTTLNANVEQLKGSWETLLTTSGTPLLGELTNLLMYLTGVVNKVMEWTQAHPAQTAMLLKAVIALAMFNLTMGASKILLGNFLGTLSGSASSLLGFTKGAMNTVQFFRAFQGTAGVGELVGQSIAFGFPKLASFLEALKGSGGIILTVFKFLGGGIINLARTALVAMGPVGWIILGITAIVVGCIWAWQNNFLGFRDKARAVLDWLGQHWKQIVTVILILLGPIGWAILGLIKLIRDNWGAISAWLQNAWKETSDIGQGTWKLLGSAINAVADGVKTAWDASIGWICKKIDWLKGVTDGILNNPVVKGFIDTGKAFVNNVSTSVFGSDSDKDKNIPVLKNTSSTYQDKRTVNYNIQSTDPHLAASEISRNYGDDKYKNSRSPRPVEAYGF